MKKLMTKHRLEQYGKLKREIVMLEDQIVFAKYGGDLVTDSVRGSSTSIPYQQHDITIRGYGTQAVPRLSARKASCEAECAAVEKYIESVDDSVMRQILTRRYIENRTLKETAELVSYSESRVKQLLRGFLETLS